jgi:hypothetical protein
MIYLFRHTHTHFVKHFDSNFWNVCIYIIKLCCVHSFVQGPKKAEVEVDAIVDFTMHVQMWVRETYLVVPQEWEIQYMLSEQLYSVRNSEQLSSNNAYASSNSHVSAAYYRHIYLIRGVLMSAKQFW